MIQQPCVGKTGRQRIDPVLQQVDYFEQKGLEFRHAVRPCGDALELAQRCDEFGVEVAQGIEDRARDPTHAGSRRSSPAERLMTPVASMRAISVGILVDRLENSPHPLPGQG